MANRDSRSEIVMKDSTTLGLPTSILASWMDDTSPSGGWLLLFTCATKYLTDCTAGEFLRGGVSPILRV